MLRGLIQQTATRPDPTQEKPRREHSRKTGWDTEDASARTVHELRCIIPAARRSSLQYSGCSESTDGNDQNRVLSRLEQPSRNFPIVLKFPLSCRKKRQAAFLLV